MVLMTSVQLINLAVSDRNGYLDKKATVADIITPKT